MLNRMTGGSRTNISVNGKVASQNADGNVTYYITDVLGTVRTVTGSRGEGEYSYSYDVFGSLVSGSEFGIGSVAAGTSIGFGGSKEYGNGISFGYTVYIEDNE